MERLTSTALEIDRRELTNRVYHGEVGPAFFSGLHALLTFFVAAVSLVMAAIAAMAVALTYRELNPQFQPDDS